MGKTTVKDYVNNLDASSMTGSWTPSGTWHRIHGDCKSTTGGKWHIETMTTSKGAYKIRVIEVGSSIYTKEYASEPAFSTIVSVLQADLG